MAPRALVSTDMSDPAHTEVSRKEATIALLAEAAGCSGLERRRLEDQVVRLNLPVARELARRYRGRDVALDDLEQVAALGLVKAVRGYRADRGREFLAFAVPTIRGELRRYFRDHGWMIRPPRSLQELQASITAAEGELVQKLGRAPRPSEIAAHLDADLDLVIEALSANGCFVPSSLDAPLGSGAATELGNLLGADDAGFDGAEARAVLAPVLAELTDRERRILELRFVRGRTQAEIGADIGVTQMQVSRLLSGILGRLRSRLGVAAA